MEGNSLANDLCNETEGFCTLVGISRQRNFPEMLRESNYSPSESQLEEIRTWVWEVRDVHDDINGITGRMVGLLANLTVK